MGRGNGGGERDRERRGGGGGGEEGVGEREESQFFLNPHVLSSFKSIITKEMTE